MGYSVYRSDGNTDAEFETYVRLLRQNGVDLGKASRVLDPETGNKWLYVWPTRNEAKAFRDELAKQTGAEEWIITKVNVDPNEGPLGPIMVLLNRSADGGLRFTLHELTKAMLKSAFPQNRLNIASISVDPITWQEFQDTHGGIKDLIRENLMTLSKLSGEQISQLGFQVIDADNDTTMFVDPPLAGGTSTE